MMSVEKGRGKCKAKRREEKRREETAPASEGGRYKSVKLAGGFGIGSFRFLHQNTANTDPMGCSGRLLRRALWILLAGTKNERKPRSGRRVE